MRDPRATSVRPSSAGRAEVGVRRALWSRVSAVVILGAALLGVVAMLLGVALVLLLVPMDFALWGVFTDARVDARIDASWGRGVARARVTPTDGVTVKVFGRTVRRTARREAAHRAAARAPSRHRAWRWSDARLAWRVARRVLRSLRVRAHVRGRLGTGDPAHTAMVHGLLVAARALLRGLDTSSLRVDWTAPAVDLEGRLEARLWPAAIAWIVVSEYARARWSHRAREVVR